MRRGAKGSAKKKGKEELERTCAEYKYLNGGKKKKTYVSVRYVASSVGFASISGKNTKATEKKGAKKK